MNIPELLISVIRDMRLFRANNPARDRANAEYEARRPLAMDRGRNTCVWCGHKSTSNECHHIDGNHANNADENLAVVDALCHAYQHVGQAATQNIGRADSLRDRTILAAIPELTPQSLNLLQRAIGAALLDEAEAPYAKAILSALTDRRKPTAQAYGSWETGDFAAVMALMEQDSYDARAPAVRSLRLLFHTDVLRAEGAKFLRDIPSLPVREWTAAYAPVASTRSPSN